MVALSPPLGPFGSEAPDFQLHDVISGKTLSLADVRGEKGTVVMFICNHCPYVKSIVKRLVQDCRDLEAKGIKAVAIMSNDMEAYPDDDLPQMKAFASTHGFSFPYLVDEDQLVAKAYGAVCTPDFFGYDANLKLCYRGRLDNARDLSAGAEVHRELYEAMAFSADTGQVPSAQTPSIGCSIKWKL